MYTSFFGFKCKPFQLSPDPEFLFLSGVHKRALTYLNYGIQENFGFILITGEIGTGKTTIIRSMLKQLPKEIKLARIYNTKVSSHQLISMINEDFELETKNKDKTELLSELTDFLIKQYSTGKRSAIMIDEAQNLSVDLLEEIRLLSNLETDKSKLLQIILIGQPELNDKLNQPGLEQLRQRIAVSTHISPLGREDTEAYIYHRLKIAGNKDCVTFEKDAMDHIYQFSRGTPRLINIVCEFTFLAAFTEGRKRIDGAFIKEIVKDLRNERPSLAAAAAAGVPRERNEDPSSRQSSVEMVRKALSSFNTRLQNLEAAAEQIREVRSTGMENKRIDRIREITELSRKEEELLRKEHELLEKEQFLKKQEKQALSMLRKAADLMAGNPSVQDQLEHLIIPFNDSGDTGPADGVLDKTLKSGDNLEASETSASPGKIKHP